MNNTILASDVRDYVAAHLSEVFETMLSLKAEPGDQFGAPSIPGERVSGSVGLAGETVTGMVYLHLTAAFAIQATSAMLGLAPGELNGNAEVNDVVGEVTNMIGGGLKSWLCDAGATCVLTTPAVIRGSSFAINSKPGVEIIVLGFKSADTSGIVEIHIKFR
jgi:chemotaxis protein CheX